MQQCTIPPIDPYTECDRSFAGMKFDTSTPANALEEIRFRSEIFSMQTDGERP